MASPAQACAFAVNEIMATVAQTAGVSSCALVAQVTTGSFNSAAVASSDCKSTICSFLLQTLATGFASSALATCTLHDSATNRDVLVGDIGGLCSGGSLRTATTARPTATPAPTPAPEANNSGMIIGIIVAIVVVIVVAIGISVRRRRGKDAGTPNPLPSTAASYVSPSSLRMSYTNQSYPTYEGREYTSLGAAAGSFTSGSTSSTQSEGSLDMCNLEAYRLPTTDITMVKSLARGAYGEVWLGRQRDNVVAVKKLLGHKRDKHELQKFIYEIALLAKLDCPFIVAFVGVAWTRPSDMLLVTEYMDGGDLRNLLQANASTKAFSWPQKVHVALHIAEALVYLHSLEPKIIHRDLKSRNVLLNSKMDAKLTDFGVSRETDDATMTAGIGTYRWMAPEVLQDGHYTESADVFSFGVILAELSNEIVPYSDLRNANGNPYTDTAIMAKVMKGELQPTLSPNCPQWYAELTQRCMQRRNLDRPSALDVAIVLRRSCAALR
ncbi:TKL protein kinase [Saprolegnia diclina VS20]|uniref:TKL protein kinase n=1 Tax=Saprolegnia diclina (strain VS20) TaxID=1156394 RepID=T0PVZ9_SAPDV|nr:TKL protein kinase [Saprolegnia diclina VS20]EQC25205.1 TKL protein kinase [Saprolegnia diclina VS20]|eukprot:XP_008621376.1 TKL protein kinase [Saprolegnia diclina VS20]